MSCLGSGYPLAKRPWLVGSWTLGGVFVTLLLRQSRGGLERGCFESW